MHVYIYIHISYQKETIIFIFFTFTLTHSVCVCVCVCVCKKIMIWKIFIKSFVRARERTCNIRKNVRQCFTDKGERHLSQAEALYFTRIVVRF